METQFTKIPHLSLTLAPDKIEMFSTLLQAGILIPVSYGTTIGLFLQSLPGFSLEYITEEVQTIFLNGTATDDLETPLEGKTPVLAISAAMPGLAGAIFRKNSLHAALRTTKNNQVSDPIENTVTVKLKLFNAIARDRGTELLRQGITITSVNLINFLTSRATLLPMITLVSLENKQISKDELLTTLSSMEMVQISLAD